MSAENIDQNACIVHCLPVSVTWEKFDRFLHIVASTLYIIDLARMCQKIYIIDIYIYFF